MKVKDVAIFTAAAVFLVSCKMETYVRDSGYESESDTATATDLFLPVTAEENSYLFETNDSSYVTKNGYTLWAVPVTTGNTATFTSRTVKIVKESGCAEAGFGIIFCEQSTGVSGVYNMLTVLINTKGQYAVGKIVNGNYTNISWWTDCAYLNKGFGAINYIKVSYSSDAKQFTLTLNSEVITKFSSLSSEPFLIYGENGYVAVISPYEDLPTTSEKIKYTEISGE